MVTEQNIRDLQNEAESHGDREMAELCQRALEGFEPALESVEAVILEERNRDLVLHCWWDDRDENEGWYVEAEKDGEYVDDSMKIWFLVNVDEFAKHQGDALEKALKSAYPGAAVDFR